MGKESTTIEYTTDFAGQTVRVGDYVYYVTTGRYPDAKILRVEKITTTGLCRGTVVKSSREYSSPSRTESKLTHGNFVKVPFNG